MHEIERRNGQDAMAYNVTRGVPWHGLGQALPADATVEEMLKAADLDWEVTLEPVYARKTLTEAEIMTGTSPFIEVPGQYHATRSDDQAILGNVGDWYVPHQNRETLQFAVDILDQARGASVGARLDTAMSLRGGRIVVANLVIPGAFSVLGDDAHDLNLGVYSSHDGSLALGGDISTIRRVCMNTHNMAVNAAKTSIKIRHTQNMEARKAQAAKALGLTFDYAAAYAQVAEEMAKVEMTMTEVDGFLADLFPTTEGAGARAQQHAESTREAVKANMIHSTTIAEDLRWTRWGTFNSTSEWADFLKPTRPDSRVDAREQKMLINMQGGVTYKIKDKAFSLLKV